MLRLIVELEIYFNRIANEKIYSIVYSNFLFFCCNARNKFLILDDGFKSQCGIYFHEKIEKQNFV